ncbi:hypothetical protein [Kribbella sp. VKM Ac-2571]|uniref:hypothetical protein n=1 Tax=Kribbella sp. VKM Ac-2571 TaxID=2512222 RepID=UPI001414EE70|nr:hypothetical protein [Kribbella sp. VKM Ac-2571]
MSARRELTALRGWRFERIAGSDDWVTVRLLATASLAGSDLHSGLPDLPRL